MWWHVWDSAYLPKFLWIHVAALQWLEKKITKLDLVLEKPKMPKESKRIKTVKG